MPTIWHSGWVEVICGSMFSGKTEELIRRLKRAKIAKQKVQVFKPTIDDRYSVDHVTSHSSQTLSALSIDRPEEILNLIEDNTRVVGVDEAQFFSKEIVDVCHRLANRGLRVVIAGLDVDFRGEPFGAMPQLMATSEYVTKMSAICTNCGNPACRSQRIRVRTDHEQEEQIQVGAEDMYEARCRSCYEAPA